MMSGSQSAHYLKFLSRLYELAADFDGRQLLEVERTASKQGNDVVATVASLLCKLHQYEDVDPDRQIVERNETPDIQEGLRDILSSREVFSTNAELLSFSHSYMDISVAPKDSRDRLVRKILRRFDGISTDSRLSLRKALEDRIRSGQDGPNFVARWSKLIREL